MKIPFKKEWQLFEREDYANYFFVYSTWEGYTHMPKAWGFENGRFNGAEFIDGACNLFMPLRYYDEINRSNFRLLFTNPKKWDNLHVINKKASGQLFLFSKKIHARNPNKLNSKDILSILKKFIELQSLVHVPRGPMWQLETPRNMLNNYLHEYLEEQKEKTGARLDINESFRILCAPKEKSILIREKRHLAKIAMARSSAKKERQLLQHAKRYEWIEYGLQGRILDLKYFKDALESLKAEDPPRVIKRLDAEQSTLAKRQEEICSKFKIGISHKKIFKIVRDSLAVRLYSKYAQFHGYYALEPILRKLGKRYGMTVEELRFLSIADFRKLLTEKHSSRDWGALARSHKSHSVHISDKGKTKIWIGDAAAKVMRKIKWHEEEKENIQTENIKGQVAFKGLAKGRAKIINTVQEMAKMHQGNILVSHMTNPDIVPAMKLAAAIVTDLGGITCHAAIVARELRVPCVIGTKIATKVFKDGDHVEVDANLGVVKKIEKR